MAVQRQYSGTLGKTGNCQVAVSLHAEGPRGSSALAWRLYLPQVWARDEARRAAAGVPVEVTFRKKWELALALLDLARGWGLPPQTMLADAGYGDITEFRRGLEQRGLQYAVWVTSLVRVWVEPPSLIRHARCLTGRPPLRQWDYAGQKPQSVRSVAEAQREKFCVVTWRRGSRGPMRSFRDDNGSFNQVRYFVGTFSGAYWGTAASTTGLTPGVALVAHLTPEGTFRAALAVRQTEARMRIRRVAGRTEPSTISLFGRASTWLCCA